MYPWLSEIAAGEHKL